MNEEFEQVLEQAIKAFENQFNTTARPFGKKHGDIQGASDNAQGVQWNIAVLKATKEIRLGVNLEGMKYQNWPITTFIQNELSNSKLMETVVSIRQPEQVIVHFTRDAWQMASRPEIEERHFAHSGSYLDKIEPNQWHETLSEALSCLDPKKSYRGRGLQWVTKRTGKLEMPVSPHLNIHTYLSYKGNSIESVVAEAHQNLKPIYEWVKRQAR